MNILYITTNLLVNSSAAIRNISLINGLVENNCSVDIITLDYPVEIEDPFLKESLKVKDSNIIKLKIKFYNKLKNKIKKESYLKKTIINQLLRSFISFSKNFIFFPDSVKESIKNVKNIKLEKRYDFIVSSSDLKTSHFIAEKVIMNNKLKIPWIQIWGDPWEKDIYLKGINSILKYRIRYSEKKLLKKASKIFYISKLTALEMQSKYSFFKEKIFVLDRSYLKRIDTITENDSYIFSYTGTIKFRNVMPLINSIEDYNKNNHKKIKLNFYGVEKEDLKNIPKKSFINIFERKSFKEILEIYKETDVLVYIDNLNNTSQVPGKIYDYFGTNKVILGLYENENSKNLFTKFRRIEFIKNGEEIELKKILKKINTEKVLEEFSAKKIAEEFLKKIF